MSELLSYDEECVATFSNPMDPLKIINIVGARPNLPKIAPLIREMEKHPNIKPILVHTGQHYDDQLSDIFFREMSIPAPDVNLGVGSGSHAAQTAEVLRGIEPVLLEYKPDIVLVVGDVNSTIAVALAASKLGIRVAHVEAGLRSFDRTMPEEINRILTDALADYLFATEQDAVDNLLKEGRPRESIFLVGNVMIDSLLCFREKALQSRIGEELGLSDDGKWQKYALLTLHRPSNVDSPENLAKLLDAMDSIAAEIPIIFPVHPRTKQRITDAGSSRHPNLRLIAPLGYLNFLCLLSHASFVMTDSGGIQEETTVLGVPCMTLRENTERPVTISQGTNQLVGTDPSKISAAAKSLLFEGKTEHKIPPLWDGHAAERIVGELLK
jgi:UDP-N-acetylglucosamine 2-epimerase (non-hydrolysing)